MKYNDYYFWGQRATKEQREWSIIDNRFVSADFAFLLISEWSKIESLAIKPFVPHPSYSWYTADKSIRLQFKTLFECNDYLRNGEAPNTIGCNMLVLQCDSLSNVITTPFSYVVRLHKSHSCLDFEIEITIVQ